MRSTKNLLLTGCFFAWLAAAAGAQPVRLTEVQWHGTGCYKIEMPMGTVYFEKDNGVSGFKSFVDPEGRDWIASYLPPGPKGEYRGFPNSVGNFGHAGRDSRSTTTIVDGKTAGDVVILESSNPDFTFQYWFFADRVAIKVLKSKGDYCFLLECVAGGAADAEDYFVTADGRKHIPTDEGEFDDFTPEWFYIGDPKAGNVLFLAKTPDDDAPNENHRQVLAGVHNMDLYSFGRTGKEHRYQIRGMSGDDHVCLIGFMRADRPHAEIAADLTRFLADPFARPAPAARAPVAGAPAPAPWSSAYLRHPPEWYASPTARAVADSVVQYQSARGGWPKSTDLARPPRGPADIPPDGGGRANSFDNDATTVPMQFLARVASATGEAKYRDAFLRGADYLLAAQYAHGGWPQFWPLRGEYYDHVTFNDGAMIRVLEVLDAVAGGEAPYAFVDADRRRKAAVAVQRGIDCILRTQVTQNGKLTAWCAQHDERTLAPAWARKYEPPSLSGAETVGIVRFLMAVESPSPAIVAAVEGAVAWLRSVPIAGQRLEQRRGADGRNERSLVADPSAPPLWARFYELGTDRPLYLDRDSVFNYDFAKVGYERRSGYDYHGTWPAALLATEYPAWRARLAATAPPAAPIIVEAESGTFTGWVDKHSCWHNVMLTDAPHSTHSGKALVDTRNEIGSYIEVDYDATWAGPHRITARYTHIRDDPRPAELLVNGAVAATLALPQTVALPAFKTDSVVVDLRPGKNVLRLRATAAGGLPNMDYVKVAEVRVPPPGALPNIRILEAEDGRYTGKLDHHSCWNFIAQTEAKHSGFTGEGYVDTDNKVGSHVEIVCEVPAAGRYGMSLRYVHVKDDERPAEVRVNGVVAGPALQFPRTGWWTAWTYATTPVTLAAGRNVIRLSALGAEGLVNLDHFSFSPAP
jgi:PelA/Pel-15E family pectate lyase